MKVRCPCGRLATWWNVIADPSVLDGGKVFCDECVPRGTCGCSLCNSSDPDYPFEPEFDEKGRETPCVFWMEEPFGVDDYEPAWVAHDQPVEYPALPPEEPEKS